tara:strand:+ start:1123 stop:1743 length:621 start_codon:yes stop_codon:yes gene_type:complete
MNLNKAAMFGLDARIALAIFGALSVISGAALYSAIQAAKVEQHRQNFVELVKASEQYFLDNGKTIPLDSADPQFLQIGDLIDNRESLSTWNGPYIQGTLNNTHSISTQASDIFSFSTYTLLVQLESNTWASHTTRYYCSPGNINCSQYVAISNSGSSSNNAKLLDVFNKLDASIDNSDGKAAGTVRYVDHTGGFDWLLYKGMPDKK